ncbi:MAG: UDP-N-acetylmuramoyl-L-alanyl-D-glutamate--2,6-diaminopimelate ligase [Actinomycetales bacterium]|nr:UDP-N-acetylmuramoyl-L-alanyl-D-glutamate--2,6-diaminopimelate ligase [Actinomycetales bacterium]
MAAVLEPVPPAVSLASIVDLLPDVEVRLHGHGAADRSSLARAQVQGVELDSRAVQPGQLFAALPGHRVHGIGFAQQALQHGAVAILTDQEGSLVLASQRVDVPVLVVADPRGALGRVSAHAYGEPARDLTLLAVTGTNGKTTVAAMVHAGLRAAGRASASIGTVGMQVQDQVFPASRTTPEAPQLHAALAAMRQRGVQVVVMEVSSHAIAEQRVDGLCFDVAAFTNLSQDHLDYHGTMEAYFEAKAELFTAQRADFAVIGVDDDWGRRLAAQARIPLATWSATGRPADFSLVQREAAWQVEGPAGETQDVAIALPGAFNLANAVCSYAMLRRLGITGDVIAEGLARARVPGRMEPVAGSGSVRGVVDYAHSPDAIGRVIESLRGQQAGRIIVVLGAGGDRDRSKRPLMGAMAARLADVLVVTDDNPRSEDPGSIRAAVLEGATSVTHGASGVAKVLHVPDRAEAIGAAVAAALPGDVVLVLGKGHEQGQEVAGVIHPFDDRSVLARALADQAGQ